MSIFDNINFSKIKDMLLTPLVSNPIDAAAGIGNAVSEAIANKIKSEATTKAYELLAKVHSTILFTIIWQNALLLISLIPVWFFHSAIPFYLAYGVVTSYSIWGTIHSWPYIKLMIENQSVTKAITLSVRKAIDEELEQRQFYERKIVEYLGPDLNKISVDIAKKLTPDIKMVGLNMIITLIMVFIAFRLLALPMLEHMALK